VTPETFSAWINAMLEAKRAKNEWALTAMLGCGNNSLRRWKRVGTSKHIALACSALAHGLRPWADYPAIAWDWMSGGGANSKASIRRDFARTPIEELAADLLRAWDGDELDSRELWHDT
jgi:hypothetical protein